MKKMILITLCSLLSLNFMQAKKLPDWVQSRLDSTEKKIKNSLMYYRLWNYDKNGNMILPCCLGYDIFSDDETLLIDSLKLNLSVEMVYDDEMRNRIVQLLQNEYEEWELDSLANFYIEASIISNKKEAMKVCRFDTLQTIKTALDSFYTDLKNKNPEDSILIKFEYVEKYKYEYDILKALQLDTTTIFKQAYNKIVERAKAREREYFLKTSYCDIYLAELCGYIGDKRFVQPLIEMLNKTEEDSRKKTIMEALARMRVEPYYSDYVKARTLTTEQIQDKNRLNFQIEDFVYVLGTQEAFLELSKYLLSDKPNSTIVADYEDHVEHMDYSVSYDAFYLIRDNIENKEIQEMIGGKLFSENPELIKPLYDWMQKNYGKYKIKRIW